MKSIIRCIVGAVVSSLLILDGHAAPGDLDLSFNPNPDNSVFAMATQADGKIVIGGGFDSVGGAAHSGIARINGSGTLDTGFTSLGISTGAGVNGIAVQPDGKMMITGGFKFHSTRSALALDRTAQWQWNPRYRIQLTRAGHECSLWVPSRGYNPTG